MQTMLTWIAIVVQARSVPGFAIEADAAAAGVIGDCCSQFLSNQ
jgi:hypothetical protein